MAYDRFVYWNTSRRPTREQLQMVLEDYLNGIATEVKWDHDRFFAKLSGKQTHPLRRMPENEVARYAVMATEEVEERWIEVWIGNDCIDVMTRFADELTNRIADGFAQLCARFWNGRLEIG